MEPIPIPFRFDPESFQINAPEELIPAVEAVIRSILPNAQFGTGRKLEVNVRWTDGQLIVQVVLDGLTEWSYTDREIQDERYDEDDRKRRARERVRLGVFTVIGEAYDVAPSPWGILTGVRPTKLVHKMIDRNFSSGELKRILGNVYGLVDEKIALLLDVAEKQQKFFHPNPNQPIGIYVGIPFCPTRCSYCSFAAYPLESHGHLLEPFFESLCVEIREIGVLLKELGVTVESVYLGGGTPTTIQGQKLTYLLELVRTWLVTSETCEFTVEAGRPETLSRETLHILADSGINRISINPQSMHDETLCRVGRQHTVRDVITAFNDARDVGIPMINMDIILGLPGEKFSHVRHTLDMIGDLQPDNLTVHSLALKRASRLRKSPEYLNIAQEQGEQMAHIAADYCSRWGLAPYYLYRQRYILSDLENIGYARPGTESVYNVQMMEERQTIIALGGGGITKLVAPDLSLVRLVNPKCPATYSQQLESSLPSKLCQIRQHLVV